MEIAILDWFQTLHSPLLDSVMVFITHLGDVGWIWMVLIVGCLIFKETRTIGIVLAVAFLCDVVLTNGILKPLVNRPRPFTVVEGMQLLIRTPHDASFPSGHTAMGFAMVSALYSLKKWKSATVALVLASLIAISRLYLYVHYPTDILGGIIVGSLSGVLAYFLTKKYTRRIA